MHALGCILLKLLEKLKTCNSVFLGTYPLQSCNVNPGAYLGMVRMDTPHSSLWACTYLGASTCLRYY